MEQGKTRLIEESSRTGDPNIDPGFRSKHFILPFYHRKRLMTESITGTLALWQFRTQLKDATCPEALCRGPPTLQQSPRVAPFRED